MFLAVDVGNSNIHVGLFTQTKPVKTFIFPCGKQGLNQFFFFLKRYRDIKGLILSDAYGTTRISKTSELKELTEGLDNYILLTPDTDCGLKIKYNPKSSLGTDRIANCVAAHTIYQRDCLVVDFGTATTFNMVSKQGEFLGGLILPGITSIYNAYPQHLLKNTNVKNLKRKPDVCVFSTSQAVNFGVYYTFIGAVEKIKQEIEMKLKRKVYTIAAGGGVKFIPKSNMLFNDIDRNLTLKGLAIIYKRLSERR